MILLRYLLLWAVAAMIAAAVGLLSRDLYLFFKTSSAVILTSGVSCRKV